MDYWGFPGGSECKASALQCGRPGFDSWVWKIPWRRKWQPTPVLLPGKSHRWRSLLGYVHGVRKELDMTEQLHFLSFSWIIIHLKADKVEASWVQGHILSLSYLLPQDYVSFLWLNVYYVLVIVLNVLYGFTLLNLSRKIGGSSRVFLKYSWFTILY